MKVRDGRQLETAVRWLRSRLSRGALVLLYHRVCEEAGDATADPFSLAVSPRRFAEQLETLRRLAAPIGLDELCAALERGRLAKRTVAVTFDDGYQDTLHQAKPLLERYQVPATVFVVSGALGRPFWWDQLSAIALRARRLPARFSLTVGGRRRNWNRVEGTAGRRSLLRSLHQSLRALAEDERQAVLTELAALTGEALDTADGPRALTPGELAELAEGDLVEIGAHSVTHPPLARLPTAAQRHEIEQSKTELEGILGRRVRSFSYPYGLRSDYRRETVGLVRGAGYRRACTNVLDVARPGGDVFELPRYWVRDWSGPELARRLGRWLGS